MSDWWPLPSYACERDASPDRVVSYRQDGRVRGHAEFLTWVDQWQAAFAEQDAQRLASSCHAPWIWRALMITKKAEKSLSALQVSIAQDPTMPWWIGLHML